MSENNNEKPQEELDETESVVFGSIRPLTAAQVITFLLVSDKVLGAPCGGPCACGPCY